MKKLLLLIISILFELNGYAQTRVVRDERGEMVTEFYYRRESLVRYRGSIFLKDSVELGTFSIAGGKELQKPVLFDRLNQIFLAYMGEDFVPMKKTDLQLGNHHFAYIRDAYYETYYDAKVKILVKYGCVLKKYDRVSKDNPPPPQFVNNYMGEVIPKKYYFLQFPDKKLKEISLDKKSVTEVLRRKYKGALNLIQQWNKTIGTEADVADLLDYLNGKGIL